MARVTFDTTPAAGCINLGIGQPSPDLLAPELLHGVAERFFAHAEPAEFNYGDLRGDPSFIASLGAFVTRAHGQAADPASLFLTAGNSQAIEFVCERFTRPGDTVFVEEPCYFLAFQIFLDRGLKIVPIPLDAEGMDMAAFEAALRSHRPRLVYTIPSFNNPSGRTLSRGRRERLADLSREHDFVVAADEVYQLLCYEGEVPPAMGTLIERGNIVSMGSFSKILAPGLRVGWIQAGAALVEHMLTSGWINSGGAVNQLGSHLVRHAIDSGVLERHIDHLRAVYRSRSGAMHAALDRHFGGRARWVRPTGGYFFWVELDGDIDTAPLKPRALAAGAGFQPGSAFAAVDNFRNCLRLSFAHYREDDIATAVERLAGVLLPG